MKLALAVASICVSLMWVRGQKDPNIVSGRNTIVHLFEWKWPDIANECEKFLGPKGFAGVQISPPSENQIITSSAFRPWWERYQPISYILTTRSGTEEQLADMIKRCNAVGVRIYVDLLMNDMAAVGGTGTAGSSCDAASKSYPAVPYTADDFHATCTVNDYNNAENVRNCELSGLPDLDQSKDNVRTKLVEYIDHLTSLGVAGYRVDAAKHMWPEDLKAIYGKAKDLSTTHGFSAGTRPFFFQEVIDLGGEAIKKTEYTSFGRVLDFKFGYSLGDCFQGNNPIHWLVDWGPEWGILDENDAVVFIDNHDTQRSDDSRVLTYKKPKQYKSAIGFMLAHPLYVPRIMSSFNFDSHDQGPPNVDGVITSPTISSDGSCSNDWVCEHRWRQVYQMVEFRNVVAGEQLTKWWDNGDNQIAFSRGNKGFAAFVVTGSINTDIPTGLPAGTYCDIVSGALQNSACTGKSVTVQSDGKAAVSLSENDADGFLAIHINAKI